jgi:hypothetical protein
VRSSFVRTVAAAAAVSMAAGGAALFSGVAFAWDGNNNSGGRGGGGGDTRVNCGIPIGISGAVIGQSDDVDQCNATAGHGGNGGAGAEY